ncbi:hypothetical protein C9374_000529 [Naegleria lovaniensis]|uniref:Uncharacterized protein n=1 Tax=Naegleria lovaniensis TaxID=51637 RepID=A0AA88GWP1_NAELO|nr:uncharacterized protein C9374_000529 [Naegleria lovaniensis]KAG2388365.1 hypothetical protein C9374_000529 [Naegleria lovaniensis]
MARRWVCVMDCNCTELLKRGVAAEDATSSATLNSSMMMMFTSSLPTFSSFFSDFQSNKASSLGGDHSAPMMQSLLPDTSHTSLLYTTFIRSFSSCTHQVMVMESENTCITFLPILDIEEPNATVNNSTVRSLQHTPPSMAMLLMVADVQKSEDDENNDEHLDSEENRDEFKQSKKKKKNRTNTIYQHFCNETFLKALESVIYLFISKTTLSSITNKQPSDKVAKKIPQVKIILNSLTDIITYLLQSSSPYTPSFKKTYETDEDSRSMVSSFLQQPFEQLCLRPGRKTLKFPDIKEVEILLVKCMNYLLTQFKNTLLCSAIYVNAGLFFCGAEWHKYLNQQQLTALSIYLNSLSHSENDATIRDIPLVLRENVNTRFLCIKLIDNIHYCAIVTGDLKGYDIVTAIQSKSEDWSRSIIRLSGVLTRSFLSFVQELDEKNEITSDAQKLAKIKALLFMSNSTGSSPYFIYENFVNSDTSPLTYERIEHSLREFYINSMMTVFDVFHPQQQGEEFNLDINETYVITKQLAIFAFKKNHSLLYCVFDSTCPRHECSIMTREIMQLISKKNIQ